MEQRVAKSSIPHTLRSPYIYIYIINMAMTPFDHPSSLLTPVNRRMKNADTNKYRVAFQKVDLDIDLATNSVEGQTELSILPLDASLREIQLDCRSMDIKEVFLDGKSCEFDYRDFGTNEEYLSSHSYADPSFNKAFDYTSEHIGIQQHHLYRGKHHPLYSNCNNVEDLQHSTFPNSENLVIRFPDSYEIKSTPLSTQRQTFQEHFYDVVNVRVLYSVKNPKTGLLFHGGLHTSVPKQEWYCYTSNNDFGCSASCWVPCVDNLIEKPTWEVNLSVPRTLKDVGQSKLMGTEEAEMELERLRNLDEFEDLEEEDKIVVATSDSSNTREYAHPTDLAKKVVSFQVSHTPVPAHHVGFAIGVFESFAMVNLETGEEEREDDRLNRVPTLFYYFPGRKEEVMNTVMFLYRAIRFYTETYSSFPFYSYGMVFLPDVPFESSSFAGLSLVSEAVLYPPSVVEKIYSSTEFLAAEAAKQWLGIYVVPRFINDMWCVVGLQYFMCFEFLATLFGHNDYKFRLKQRCEKLVTVDRGKRALAKQFYRFPINAEQDLNFIKLKAPLVLFVLDRRLTKTDKSFGLSRVISKLFVQAMSNDLFNGTCLSTSHFIKVCEKVARRRLESFWNNWVFHKGCPIFRVTQKFNKKRSIIEVAIRQVQSQEAAKGHETPETFFDSASSLLTEEEEEDEEENVFCGPMTIRIHEADGTPYEHIVDIQSGFTRLDIPYNSRHRRTRKSKKDEEETEEMTVARIAEQEAQKTDRLGQVLMTEEEMKSWNLQNFSLEDEEMRLQEGFEWLRIDADFEWLCRVHIALPAYMFLSQLKQDRDVEAQYDSVKHFASWAKPTVVDSSVLVRTVMDQRYYYGIRCEALAGLAKISREENQFIGMHHMLRVLKENYCYQNQQDFIPLPNDFSNLQHYFVLKALVLHLSSVRRRDGDVPSTELRTIFLNMVRLNDNSTNKYSDAFFVCDLIHCLSRVMTCSGGFIEDHNESDTILEELDGGSFLRSAMVEINRCFKMDRWIHSYRHVVSLCVLREKISMARAGVFIFPYRELLEFTRKEFSSEFRLEAFYGLLTLGGLKNRNILHYFFLVLKTDTSHGFKAKMCHVFLRAIGVAALHGTPSILEDEEFAGNQAEESVVFMENEELNFKRDMQSRGTIQGAIKVLRRDYAFGVGLQHEVWVALHSCLLSVNCKRDLFDLADVLFKPVDSFLVNVDWPMDKKIVARVDGGLVRLTREGRFKIQLGGFKLKLPVKRSTERVRAMERRRQSQGAQSLTSQQTKAEPSDENKDTLVESTEVAVENPQLVQPTSGGYVEKEGEREVEKEGGKEGEKEGGKEEGKEELPKQEIVPPTSPSNTTLSSLKVHVTRDAESLLRYVRFSRNDKLLHVSSEPFEYLVKFKYKRASDDGV